MEVTFAMIFLGYVMYAESVIYCLIAMIAQIVFSFFIEKKQIGKVAVMIFLTQGIVIPIAHMNYDMIHSIHHYSNTLGFWKVVISKEFEFDILYSLIMFAIIIVSGFFTYRSIEGKMNCKKWIALLSGYLINIIIMLFMIFKFGIIVNSF